MIEKTSTEIGREAPPSSGPLGTVPQRGKAEKKEIEI